MKPQRKEMIKNFPKLVSPANEPNLIEPFSIEERRLIEQIRAIKKPYGDDDMETVVSKKLRDEGLGDVVDDLIDKNVLAIFLSDLVIGHVGQSLFILKDTLLNGNAAHFILEQHQQSAPWDDGGLSDSDDWQKIDQAQRVRGMA